MPRYYFDVRDRQGVHSDEVGLEFANMDAAIIEARRALADMTRESLITDGATDLSIVIRTIVMRPGRTTIGAGGAIVMQSDPQEEFDELLLKARAPMAAIAATVTGSEAETAWSVELEPSGEVAGAR